VSTYVVRIRKSRDGDRSGGADAVTPQLISGLAKKSGAELTYMQSPSRDYPLTLVCNDLDNLSVIRFLNALDTLQGVRTEVARLF
jgi:hypothetical protein